ncbi:MAG: hypothetical protein ACYTFX_08605 [Planctomycetota bacterium]|jgi:hypothetical protein
MADSLWGNLFSGALGAYGYGDLMDQMSESRDDLQTNIGNLQTGVDERTQFQPWGVMSGLGAVTSTPDGLHQQLSPQQLSLQKMMFGGAKDFLGQASADTGAREQDVYDRLMALQQPSLDRQSAEMRERLYNTGRTGVRSNAYGGSPEELAMAKAQSEAQNQASLMALQQAQSDQLQNYNIGQGMFASGYQPYQQQMALLNAGLNNQQLAQRSQLDNASLWTQLGLGGLTADTNYANIGGNAFGNLISALLPAAGSLGDSFTESGGFGGLWDTIKGIIPTV